MIPHRIKNKAMKLNTEGEKHRLIVNTLKPGCRTGELTTFFVMERPLVAHKATPYTTVWHSDKNTEDELVEVLGDKYDVYKESLTRTRVESTPSEDYPHESVNDTRIRPSVDI